MSNRLEDKEEPNGWQFVEKSDRKKKKKTRKVASLTPSQTNA
jgi:hypothetical protein